MTNLESRAVTSTSAPTRMRLGYGLNEIDNWRQFALGPHRFANLRQAAAVHSPDIIMLPEACTSPNAFHPSMNDVARPIRKALANKLAFTKSAPAEVIEILANDEATAPRAFERPCRRSGRRSHKRSAGWVMPLFTGASLTAVTSKVIVWLPTASEAAVQVSVVVPLQVKDGALMFDAVMPA